MTLPGASACGAFPATSNSGIGQGWKPAFIFPMRSKETAWIARTLESGRFYNVFAGSDVNGDGNPTSDRPGTLGRNTLESPGFATVDLRVARTLRHERTNGSGSQRRSLQSFQSYI
jgi:hypothetical protein